MVAWAALILWPLFSLIFFASMSLPAALIVTIVGGYLFLPEQMAFDLPVLPPLDKNTIPTVTALVLTAWAASKMPNSVQKGYLPRHPVVLGLFVMLFIGVVGTGLTNGDPVFFQERWRDAVRLPGLRTWDLLAAGLVMVMTILPFLLGRKYLATPEAQLKAMKAYILLALSYTVLALIEIRLSPQMNTWVYGFFPHSFAQHIRGGGFRPLVFLNHGLWLAIFFTTAIIATAGLARSLPDGKERTLFMLAMFWILATLTLSRSLGALLIALIFLALLTQPQRILHIGILGIVAIVICYPLLRSAGLIPTGALLDFAARISPERAQSLGFRLTNEQTIMDHALERPFFGWGGWGRNTAEVVVETGKRAVPDGRWTISFGHGGYVRFLSEFGLLVVGILGAVLSRKPVSFTTTTVAALLAANIFDLLPNGTLTTLTWLWAGALAGRMELAREDVAETRSPAPAAVPTGVARNVGQVYSRNLGSRDVYKRQFKQTDPS